MKLDSTSGEDLLPPLPEPKGYDSPGGSLEEMASYSADQMRAYALAERERCAKLCDDLPAKDANGPWFNDDMSAGAYACAAAIRKG